MIHTKTVSALIVVILMGLMVTGIIATRNATNKSQHPNSFIELPSELGYKQIEHRNSTDFTYHVFDVGGMEYYVSESQFDTLAIPQKIDDNLYRLPDGSFIAQLVK